MRSQWRLIEVKKGIAFIEDLDGPVSVTNDAENVFSAIVRSNIVGDGGKATRVVYLDTYGEWTEIEIVPNDLPGYWRVAFKPWHGLVWDTLGR